MASNRLSDEVHGQLRDAGMTPESYAAMLRESVSDMVEALQRCTVTDPELVDADFCPDGTVSGSEWLELHGFPERSFREDADVG